ncbi:MAG: DUF4363 family protein [Tuberibacillus sp.]
MVFKTMTFKWVMLTLLLFGLAANTASANAPKDIQTKLKNLSGSILKSDWDKAYKQTVDLRDHFNKNRWKYQLLGDEQEYEGISNDIENLKAAIIAKDKASALIFVYDIKEVFNQIYQM